MAGEIIRVIFMSPISLSINDIASIDNPHGGRLPDRFLPQYPSGTDFAFLGHSSA